MTYHWDFHNRIMFKTLLSTSCKFASSSMKFRWCFMISTIKNHWRWHILTLPTVTISVPPSMNFLPCDTLASWPPRPALMPLGHICVATRVVLSLVFDVVSLTNLFLIKCFSSKLVKTANGRCRQWFSLLVFSTCWMNKNKTRRKPFYFWIMQRPRGIRNASGKCARPRGNSHFPGGKLHSPWENLHAPG